MAYYENRKHKFIDLIDSVKSEIAKSYLLCKCEQWLGENMNDAWVEQWLYNQTYDEIYNELCGFIQGYLEDYDTVEIVCTTREVLPKLALIYKQMCEENSWGDSKNLEDWLCALDLQNFKQKKN